MAAQDHSQDQTDNNYFSHRGLDGSSSATRIKRYGGGYIINGENISYDATTAREIVVSFLIDDGVPDRGHRENVIDPNYTQIGCGFRGVIATVDFANGYADSIRD